MPGHSCPFPSKQRPAGDFFWTGVFMPFLPTFQLVGRAPAPLLFGGGGPQPSLVFSEVLQGSPWDAGLVHTPSAAAARLVKMLRADGREISPWPDNPSLHGRGVGGRQSPLAALGTQCLCLCHLRHARRWFIHTGVCASGVKQGQPLPQSAQAQNCPSPGEEATGPQTLETWGAGGERDPAPLAAGGRGSQLLRAWGAQKGPLQNRPNLYSCARPCNTPCDEVGMFLMCYLNVEWGVLTWEGCRGVCWDWLH